MKQPIIWMILTVFPCLALGETALSETGAITQSESLNYAHVTHVVATQKPNGTWCFDTTVRHNDEGWDHYADGWEVIGQQGKTLGVRPLAHPHDNEQPFTRRLCNIEIPANIATVTVRAKCNVHGFGGNTITIDLNIDHGRNYSLHRPN
ncbi:hypothetical protein [uncultured Vibrio sp.]|uniref:hypothetical protein n=1 Tax=uncultured Vibrio sp. TaxID=114054 RepID=UPI0025E56CA8|nr:hypothetical protein [uncultured Vibrio sp.]